MPHRIVGGKKMLENNGKEIKGLYELNKLTAEQKQDIEIIKTVESFLKEVASEWAYDARFEYDFGQYDGENVEKWELSKAEQFKALYEEFFPNNEENKTIYNYLCDKYFEYPEVINELGKEKDILKEELEKYQYIQEHKHDIITQFEQNYKIFEHMQQKYVNFFDKVETYKLSPINLTQANYLIEALRGQSLFYYEEQVHHVERELGDLISEKAETINQLTLKLEELQNRKILFFYTKETRSELNDTKNQIQALRKDIEEHKEDLKQFKKESKQLLSDAKLNDNFQHSDTINHILYNEFLYAISDKTVDERKERFEKAIDERLDENNPNIIKERISEIDDILSRQTPEDHNEIIKENVHESVSKTNDIFYKCNKFGVKDMIEKAKQKKESMKINDDHKKMVEKGIER